MSLAGVDARHVASHQEGQEWLAGRLTGGDSVRIGLLRGLQVAHQMIGRPEISADSAACQHIVFRDGCERLQRKVNGSAQVAPGTGEISADSGYLTLDSYAFRL